MAISPMEKQEIMDRINGMSEEQVKLVLECIPSKLLCNEIDLRLAAYETVYKDMRDVMIKSEG